MPSHYELPPPNNDWIVVTALWAAIACLAAMLTIMVELVRNA